jgi:hypothetical protein
MVTYNIPLLSWESPSLNSLLLRYWHLLYDIHHWKIHLHSHSWKRRLQMRKYWRKVKGKKVKLFLCLTNQALRHEGVWGSRYIDPHFLDRGTSWRWVVSFTPRPPYPRGKSHRYPLDRRWLGGPQSRSERHGEEKILDLTESRTSTPRLFSP